MTVRHLIAPHSTRHRRRAGAGHRARTHGDPPVLGRSTL